MCLLHQRVCAVRLDLLPCEGKGAQQDAVMASMWSNLAASQLSGEDGERVGKVRAFIGSKLAPDQLAKAQDLARNWKAK